MPKITRPLTNTEINNARGKAKEYNLADGLGLALRVRPGGEKYWIFNYQRPITKIRANISLGIYPAVSLSSARVIRSEYRDLLAQGIDPKHHRKDNLAAEQTAAANTLEKVAADWLCVKKSKVSNDHGDDIWRSLALHIFPYMGQAPINSITAPAVISVLKPIEVKGSYTTSTFLPVPPGSPSLSPSQNTQDRESSEKNLRDFFGDNAPPGPASSSAPPTPHAVHRSGTRSALEWDDLRLIATYMTTTRLLSAGLDEWRARTSSAKTRRRLAREQRRVVAVAERERCRVEFARQVLIRWRETCHTLTRERRARYGSVSRASIRKLTRSPAHARGRSPMSPDSNVSRSGGSGGTPGYGSERKSHGGTGGRFSPNGSERFVMTTGSGARVVSASGRLSEEEFSSSRRTTETR